MNIKDREIKILHINTNYTNNLLHQNLVQSLSDYKINNTVFVPAYRGRDSLVENGSNIIISDCFRKWDRVSYKYKQKKIFSAIKKCVDVNEFSLIHAHTVFTDGNIAYQLKKEYHIPYVVAVRNTDINAFFKYMVHLRKKGIDILKNAEYVVFLSKAYKNILLNQYCDKESRKIIEKKAVVIPNGIDEFWIEKGYHKKRAVNRKKIKLVYAGKVNRNKNILMTAQMMEVLEKKYHISSQLTIVGKVEDRLYFRKVLEHPNIKYLEARPKEELVTVYRKNDIFVMPSKTETFGLVYAEAMSQGLPIIYTKGQGFDGQFKEGTVGYRVDPKNPGELADRIIDILDNYDMLSKNALKGCKKFKWHNITRKYIALYDDVMKKRSI